MVDLQATVVVEAEMAFDEVELEVTAMHLEVHKVSSTLGVRKVTDEKVPREEEEEGVLHKDGKHYDKDLYRVQVLATSVLVVVECRV